MTEDEAKTKWCPFANQGAVTAFRVVTAVGVGSSQHTCCIASACMAWRKIPGKSQFKDARTGKLSDRDLTGNGTWIESGHCGLAGAPQ